MKKYCDIKQKLLDIAKTEETIRAVIIIGSSVRTNILEDEYSDLDLVIVTDYVDEWLYGEKPEQLGKMKISCVEPVLGGGKKRRISFDGYLDVDMVLFSTEQFLDVIENGIASMVMGRGYQVWYDVMDCTALLSRSIVKEIQPAEFSEEEFCNMVNDFFFHTIWAEKKILRGELWSAKMCVDAYLKNCLLRIIEMYSHEKLGTDVWHNGRFLDNWAEEGIKEELRHCFAHYEKSDIEAALVSTRTLFAGLARETAKRKGYKYPFEAEKYAKNFV